MTSGAVSVAPSDRLRSAAQAQVWGLGRVIGLEHPRRWGGLIDLPEAVDTRTPARLAALLGGTAGRTGAGRTAGRTAGRSAAGGGSGAVGGNGAGGEDEVALRPAGVFARRLVRAAVPAPADRRWQPRDTVMVTGGTGALGAHAARWLARAGAGHLVLTSRRGGDAPGASDLRAELEGLGARVTIAACDVADRAAVDALLHSLDAEGAVISAVVHTAGVSDLTDLADLGLADLAGILDAKVTGATNLADALAGRRLDAFVVYSSGAGVWGGGGQGAYAAANAFLDAFAEQRRAAGLPVTSVAWGAWAEGGMVSGDVAERLRRLGVRQMAPELALTALREAVEHDETALVVADIDWPGFLPGFLAARRRPLFADLPEAVLVTQGDGLPGRAGQAGQPASDDSAALPARLADLTGSERRQALLDLVRGHAADVLKYDGAQAIQADRAFRELGFDSLAAVELRNRLGAATGLRLPATLAFDFPTATAIARYLMTELFGESSDAAPSEVVPGTSAGGDAGAGTGTGSASGSAAAVPAAGALVPTATADDPIAIVAMACRYPGGVEQPEQLWRLLVDEVDAIGAFPDDRGWPLETLFDPSPGRTGTTTAREGGFLDDVAGFDAGFFGVSPREATVMDPQQRLLLQTAWEVLERARIDPASLRGTPTGVFVGGSGQDYGPRLHEATGGAEGYVLTGSATAVLSGRVAYALGLEGSAVTVDTACSSSLVALHLAGQALRRGECSLALAGGVTVMVTPGAFVEFSRQRGLAPDGRCKAFAAGADGTGWGEGVGLLLLERLSDARRNGHPVLAVVRGSAMNSDGASNGLTAPNGPAQQRVIRRALADARLSVDEVDAVEAHGTGTRLGDPIEAQALLATYGRSRPADRPLWLGSIKSNIGHTQSAAGVAGVIKMVLAMRHGLLPKTLHAQQPTEQVDWSAGAVSLLAEARPWPRTGRPRRAGVSAFGISGTNVHVILEQVPDADPAAAGRTPPSDRLLPAGAAGGPAPSERTSPFDGDPLPYVVSARGQAALRGQARRLRAHLDGHAGDSLTDLAYSLATTRAALPHRAVVLAADRDQLLRGLDALADDLPGPNIVRGVAREGRSAFLFPGQGSQRPRMGQQLYGRFPVFAQALDEVCDQLDVHLDRPLREILFAGDGSPEADLLHQTLFAQTGLFALEVALNRLLGTWGLRPDYLLGHSVGELAAAHAAGVFSLTDAAALVAARGRLMQDLPPGGLMIAVQASEQEMLPVLAGREEQVSLAAVNGPQAVVISGAEEAVLDIADHWQRNGRKARGLKVSHAFHSPHMDAMLAGFRTVAAAVTYAPPRIPVVSTLTGAVIPADELCSADYWVRQVRHSVRFLDGVRTLLANRVTTFLELGPAGVLTAMGRDCLADDGAPSAAADDPAASFVAVLRADRAEVPALTSALAHVHAGGSGGSGGSGVGWAAFFADRDVRPVELPTYAFQPTRYWLEAPAGTSDAAAVGLQQVGHPLLGAGVELPDGAGFLFTGRLSAHSPAWLSEHAVLGGALLPGTAYVEMAAVAAERLGCAGIAELALHVPLPLPVRGGVVLRLTVGAADTTGRRPMALYSRAQDAAPEAAWTRHATGLLQEREQPSADEPGVQPPADAGWPPADAVPVDVEDLYHRLAERGFDYGPAFRGLRAAWRQGDDVLAEVHLPPPADADAGRFGLHPALLDAALHAIALLDSGGPAPDGLPFAFGDVHLHARGASALRVRLARAGEGISLAATDLAARPVVSVGSLVLRPMSAEQIGGVTPAPLYALRWERLRAAVPAGPSGHWALLGDVPEQLSAALARRGATVTCHPDPQALREAVASGAPVPEAVLTVLPSGTGSGALLAARARAATGDVARSLRSLLADDRLRSARLVLLTSGAAAVREDAELTDPVAAAVGGLVRSAQSEHPGRCVLVDVDGHDASWAALTDAAGSGEPQTAVRAGAAHVPRLAHARLTPSGDSTPLDPEGTVLITGGTTGLGALLARHLVTRHKARHLVLASRRGAQAPGAAELRAELTGLGAHVELAACDVADRDALARLLTAIPAAHPLTAVVHAAGIVRDGVIASLTPESIEQVMLPKVDGAVHLHELTATTDLAAFVLFSSMSGVLGGAGQGNYAAANAFLDALAAQRRAAGLPAVSIAWGPWAHTDGMASRLRAADHRRLRAAGLVALAPGEGLAAFDAALTAGRAVVAPVRLDVAALRADSAPPLLSGLLPARRPGPRPDEDTPRSLRRRLAALPGPEQHRLLLDLLRVHTAAVLGHGSTDGVDTTVGFLEAGFDSLTAVELRNQLTTATGLRLPTTLLFDHPTPALLAEHLRARILDDSTGGAADQGGTAGDPGGAGASAASPPVLAALSRLEPALATVATDSTVRTAVITRLRDVLAAWTAADEPGPDGVDVADRLRAATAEEVFDFIDNQIQI